MSKTEPAATGSHWPESVFTAATTGDLGPAEQQFEASPDEALSRYLMARCLLLAGSDPERTCELLRLALEAEPTNRIWQHSYALARWNCGTDQTREEACELWRELGMPHETTLLALFSLALGFGPEPLVSSEPPQTLPPLLAERFFMPPEPTEQEQALIDDNEQAPSSEPSEPVASTSPPPAKISSAKVHRLARHPFEAVLSRLMALPDLLMSGAGQPPWLLRRRLAALGEAAMTFRHKEVLEKTDALLSAGIECDDLHLIAGFTCEELGDYPRARAHLCRVLELSGDQLLARALLGRVWWRCGWQAQAIALWQTIPVEGPSDFGRHYLLALGAEGHGERARALAEMEVALTDFYFDTREMFVERSFKLWLRHYEPASPKAENPAV